MSIAEDESLPLMIEESPPVSTKKSVWVKAFVAAVAAAGLLFLGVRQYASVEFDPMGGNGQETNLVRILERYAKQTHRNAGKEVRPIFLDRHDVDCGDDAISRFRLGRQGSSDIKYNYDCLKTSSLGVKHVTRHNNGKRYSKRVHYLDRQNWIDCGNNGMLTRFRAKNEGGDYVSYDYTCKTYNGNQHSCDVKKTGSSNIKNEYIYYLDRFNIDCGHGALTGFKPSGAHGSIKYEYKCCYMDTYDPSPAPISNPTHVPISHPTHQPTIAPTKANAIFCPLTVSQDYLGALKNLKEGCMAIANEDVNWEKFSGSTKAMVICTSEEISTDQLKLKHAHLNNISYLMAGKNVQVTYNTDDGKTHRFHHNKPVVHNSNDNIVSMIVDGTRAHNVPTQCMDV